MHAFKHLPVFLVLIFFYSNTFATAQDDFDKGVSYFKQQQYQQAAHAFTRAYKQGLKTPALLHNLGVSYFKLGNYPQAKKYFELARKDPQQRMLAEYNLGLVAKKQGNTAVARQHFRLVKKQARDNKLLTLARIQLGEIKILKPTQHWSAYTEARFGHDDNITILNDNATTATKKSSYFVDLYIGGDLLILGDAKTGIALTGFASTFDYVDYDRYDDSRVSMGLEATFPAGNWANAVKLSSQTLRYGHADYQKINRLQAKTRKYIRRDTSLRFRYQYDDINSQNPVYDYLAGNRQRFRTELRNYGKHHYAKLYYEYEQNDRVNTATASYSPVRNSLRAYYEYSITNSLDLGGDINFRVSNYPARATTAARQDERTRLGIRLTYELNKTWKVRARLEQTDNESDNPAYSYQRQETSLALIGAF